MKKKYLVPAAAAAAALVLLAAALLWYGRSLSLLRRPLGPAGHLHRAGQWKHRPE